MKQLSVLLVESSSLQAYLVSGILAELGYKVELVTTLLEVADFLSSHTPVHLVMSGLVQHGFSGLKVAEVVHENAKVPLPVFLYGHSLDTDDAQVAKRAGVDRLLKLPLSPLEVSFQLNPLLSERYPWAYPSRLSVGDIELNAETHTVRRKGRFIELTEAEFALLKKLLSRPGVVFSREELFPVVSIRGAENIRTVDTRIKTLKAALTIGKSVPPIKGIRGFGYKLERPPVPRSTGN